MKAVGSGNIDEVLSLGTNAAQAAAQPLLVAGKQCSVSARIDSNERHQGLAVFLFNGVRPALRDNFSPEQSELLRFAFFGADIALMRGVNPYIREIACLHGLGGTPRHGEMLLTAFDEDEELAMDAIEQLQESASP
jgi:hypothetical protein